MMEILFLFGPALLASIFSAGAMSALGPHLILRQLSFQLFSVHQWLMFLALILSLWIEEPSVLKIVVLAAGFLPSYWIFKMPLKNRELFLILLYLLGLSSNLLVVRFFSELEIHFTRGFFGDPALVSTASAWGLLILAVGVFAFLMFSKDRLLKMGFEMTTFSFQQDKSSLEKKFKLLLTLVLMIFLLEWGFLFCLASLFLPAIVLSSKSTTWFRFQTQVVIAAFLGCFLGFSTSIVLENIAATPAIVMGLFLSALMLQLKKSSSH
jgi:ABC-type Mn2+/Zn2+ transport system permease subunit